MKKYFYLFLVLFVSSYVVIYAGSITLKDKLLKSKKGDYIVFEYNKIYSLVSIFEINDKSIILEETTISKDLFNNKLSFKNWFENGALNNTSWTIYKIDLKSLKITDAYSISRNSWINLIDKDSFLCGLLNLNLNEIKELDRKRIGPPPLDDEMDRRQLFNPIKIVDSKKIKNQKFKVFRSIWPDDKSEFANKMFDIYFDDICCFPYFIEINNGHLSFIIKAVDSGENLISKTLNFPQKLTKINKICKNDKFLTIYLINAQNFLDYNLFAIDISKNEKTIHPLDFKIINQDDNTLLLLDINSLNAILEKNHKYKIVANVKFQKDIFIESDEILVWK